MSAGSPSPFVLVHVSEDAFDIIADLEAAWCRFNAADPTNMESVGNAYAALCQRRKELHEYIARLEREAGIPRPIQLRFD